MKRSTGSSSATVGSSASSLTPLASFKATSSQASGSIPKPSSSSIWFAFSTSFSKVLKPPPIRRLSPGWWKMQLAAADQVDHSASSLYRQRGIPVVLMEQRIGTSKKLGRRLTVTDRPATGPVTGQEHSPLFFRRLVPYSLRRGSHPGIQA